jgi:minor extracellular serine protease Vpr
MPSFVMVGIQRKTSRFLKLVRNANHFTRKVSYFDFQERFMRFRRDALVLLLLLLGLTSAFAQNSVPATAAENTTTWLVELTGAPTADGGSQATLTKEKDTFRKSAAAAGIIYQERKSFGTLWDGFAITASRSSATAISILSGVKAVYPDMVVAPDPKDSVATPDMAWAVNMTGADLAQNALGLTGKGVKVAVIDTGIDYMHPDLGGCFGVGCRVEKGWDLVGDKFNADSSSATYNPVLVPGPDPMDCAGHGTHVAGIIGANGDPTKGGVRGVAPGVTYYAYRVFGCEGSTLSSVMIEAMERALNDGAQVVNMSIGAAFQTWPEYPTAEAADRLVKRGVVVVTSYGNSGASGLYSGGAPGVGNNVIGVASFDNKVVPGIYFTADNGDAAHQFVFFPATGAPAPPTSGAMAIVKTGTPTSTSDGCTALPAGSLSGKAVLIRRGTCSFFIKASNAQNAGAIAVVLYNNTTGTINPTVTGSPAITIPVVAVTAADGLELNNRIAIATTNITWTDQYGAAPSSTAGLISSFSSYGLDAELNLKPDIGAPGGNILSTYPRALGSYAVLSGTSMASPHTAGTVALLLEAQPKLQAWKVRDVLQNSAVPKNWWSHPEYGLLDNVQRQGAGMVNIYNAVLATSRVTPGKLSLGDTKNGPVTKTLTIENRSKDDLTYNISWTDALATGPNTFTPSFYAPASTVTFSTSSLAIPAGGSATFDLTIAPDKGLPDKSVFGGYVVIKPSNSDNSLRVPAAGLKGSYQSIVVLAPTAYGFPWMASVVGTSYVPQTAATTYTMQGNDVPYFLVHLDHQCAKLQLVVTETATGKNWQFADNESYLPRNANNTGTSFFFSIPWDGTTANPSGHNIRTVPNGQYTVTLRVLKALGNPDNPADWETWSSPPINVARP